jgi:hypothetical protein
MEREIAQEFIESLEARDLPEKFFYCSPAAAENWLSLLQESMYDDLRENWKQVAERSARVAADLSGPVSVFSFGAGSGWADRLFLAGLLKAGREVRYFPVDASQVLLEEACASAEDDDIETLGIKADISSPTHLVLASDTVERSKIFLMPGNTLGAFDPMDQIRHIAECLGAGDRLVIDAELYHDGLVAEADTPARHRFALAPLVSAGVTEEDGEVKFDCKRDERHAGLWLLTRRFKASHDLSLTVAGHELELARGERISLNFEYRYSAEAFRWIVTDRGKMKIVDEIPGPGGRFLTLVCSR